MDLSLYIGYDLREAVGSHVFIASMLRYASAPVPVTILDKGVLERNHSTVKEGTNAFTLSRFLVPYFQSWKGVAIFCDGADMLLRDDIYKIMAYHNPSCAVQVVKHNYKTKWPRKYVGTAMEANNEDYDRKNWASMMLINCGHYAWRNVTPEYINRVDKLQMLQFRFLEDKFIDSLPVDFNWLCDEYGHNDEAKLLHWTTGVPGFVKYNNMPHAEEWFRACNYVNNITD